MLKIENELHEKGYNNIACIDEVGRGCLSGDVTACAVIMPERLLIDGVNDSKKLSKKKREKFCEKIKESAISIGIGTASSEEIDEMNIKKATHLAMGRAIENLLDEEGNRIIPDFLLIDAETIALKIPQEGIIKGDAKCHGIAAASIVAKVTRDKRMAELHEEYPVYNFKKNAGYGTKEHIDALLKKGKCKIHRNTFIRKILDRNEQLKLL